MLAAGGSLSSPAGKTAELYDPGAGSWSPAASMAVAREDHTATLLCNGRVLVPGGSNFTSGSTASAELYRRAGPPRLTGANLLTNGNAEASVPAPDGGTAAAPVGWVVTPNFTVRAYSATGDVDFPDALESARIGGGANFFAGGPATPSSTACQAVDVSRGAAGIDAHRAKASLSADLGGFGTEADSATVTATFRSASGAPLGSFAVGPVTPGERGDQGFLEDRSRTARVPAGTRSIAVVMGATRVDGPNDDGYADNVSFGVAVAPAISKLRIKPRRFRVAGHKPRGTQIAYTDSARGFTTFTVLRRRMDGSVKAVGSFAHASAAGKNSFHFAGRVAGHALTPGRYRLRAVPTDANGHSGPAAAASFRVLAPARG